MTVTPNDDHIIIPWNEAPKEATPQNPYRVGPALTKRGRITGIAPEVDTDNDAT